MARFLIDDGLIANAGGKGRRNAGWKEIEARNLGNAGAPEQGGDYAEKSRHIFRVDRSGAAQQKKELRRDLAHQHQGDSPEYGGDHRSRCPRIDPAAEQHEQKQAADQQKGQHRAPKRFRTFPFLKVSAHNAASRFALSSAPGTAIPASTQKSPSRTVPSR